MDYWKRGRLIALSGLVAVLAGCAANDLRVQPPVVRLTGVETGEVDFTRQTFLLDFEIENPNPFPLPVRAVAYRVLLDDRRFAGGETNSAFTVPARGGESFTILVDLDLLRAGPTVTSIVQSAVRDAIDYELAGSLAVDIPLMPPIEFASRGTIMVQADLR